MGDVLPAIATVELSSDLAAQIDLLIAGRYGAVHAH
jgi:hypothetical protein